MTKKRVFVSKHKKDVADTGEGSGLQKKVNGNGSDSGGLTSRRMSRKIWWIIVGIILLMLLMIGASMLTAMYLYRFEEAAGISGKQLITLIDEGRRTDPFSATGKVTLALLGTDELDQRNGAPALTDTIMLITVQNTGQVHVISIPRDLWIDEYKTKINALYTLAEENEPGSGSLIIKTTLGNISGLPIDYLVIMNMETVKHIVDALGGVTLDVERAFRDERYPRSGVDISSDDPTVLYETIAFEQGRQQFDGDTALKYIRSRQSTDPNEGTDIARNHRQQQVLMSVFQQIQPGRLVRQITLVGHLFRIYKDEVETDLPDTVIVGMGKHLWGKPLTLTPLSLPIANEEQSGLLHENPKNSYGLWVLEPVDASWQEVNRYITARVN